VPLTTEHDPEASPQTPAIDPNQQTLVVNTQRVDVDVSTSNTTLTGPITITALLDPNNLGQSEAAGEPMPMSIRVQKSVRYVAATDEILLDGPCLVTLQQKDPNYLYEYTLSAPKLALGLIEDPNAEPNDIGISLRRFTAFGGPVAVHARRKAGADWVGQVEVLASKLDYRTEPDVFTVTGPGEITLHNAEVLDGQLMDAEIDANDLLAQPCYAFLKNFDAMTYSGSTNRITVDANSGRIRMDYFPLIDGTYDRHMLAYVGHIDVELTENAEGRTDLLSLTASRGIQLEDEASYTCYGSTLVYDHKRSLITVVGDESQACSFNGALVDKVEIDAQTGDTKTDNTGPSMLQISP